MAFSLALNRTGITYPDFRIKGGRLVISTFEDAARDRIFTALSTQLGEWFLDNTDGVPYMPANGSVGILGGKMSEAEVGSLLRQRILLDRDVDYIITMSITQSARREVSVSADVMLKNGNPITIEV